MRFAVAFACTVAVVSVIGITWAGYLAREAESLYAFVNRSIEDAKR